MAVACGGERRDQSFVVRDSAGIEIVESQTPVWGDAPAWRLAPEPEVVIGRAEGDPAYLLAQARGARRLSDGRIVVLDAGASELRVYGPDGRHSHDIGREGEGPGEFQRLHHLYVLGDTLIAYELWPPTVSWFTPDGSLIRTARIPNRPEGEVWRNLLLYGFTDRYGIAESSPDVFAADFRDGVNRLPRPLWRFALDGSSAERIGTVPGDEMVLTRTERGVRMTTYAFGHYTNVATSGRFVYVAPTDAYAIRVHDEAGELRRIVRKGPTPRAVDPGAFDEWVECRLEWLDPDPEERAEVEANTRSLQHGAVMPAFRSVTADAEGNLWVEAFDGCLHRQGTFEIFDRSGRWLGAVELPPGLARSGPGPFEPWLEIGADYVLGVWRDELDIDQVRLYRIEKPSASSPAVSVTIEVAVS